MEALKASIAAGDEGEAARKPAKRAAKKSAAKKKKTAKKA